eukprot:226991_1
MRLTFLHSNNSAHSNQYSSYQNNIHSHQPPPQSQPQPQPQPQPPQSQPPPSVCTNQHFRCNSRQSQRPYHVINKAHISHQMQQQRVQSQSQCPSQCPSQSEAQSSSSSSAVNNINNINNTINNTIINVNGGSIHPSSYHNHIPPPAPPLPSTT